MVTGSSLLALAMAAMGAGPADEPISCQIRLLTMDGLGWRSDYYPRLQPVARRGTSAVWTADRALAETMTSQALTATVAPVCTNPGQTTVDLKATTCYVAHLERLADGPKNQATALAFLPETASVEEGFRAIVSGRKLDQGVLARVSIEESHVKTMHAVKMTETLPTPDSRPAGEKLTTDEILGRFLESVQMKLSGEVRNLGIIPGDRAHALVVETKTPDKPGRRVAVQIQVPELSNAKVEGEWLIPREGVLLVSLGVDTVADSQGKAAVRERIAILEVAPAPAGPALTQPNFENGRPWPAPAPRVAMPAVPSRSMPVPFDPGGRMVDLPPIPESVASADLDRIKPAPDRPSPQALHASEPARARDSQVARTGLEAPMVLGRLSSEPVAGRSMPALPARSIPVAVAPDGRVVDLPPLPEAVASADLNRISPEPGQLSGQALHVALEPNRDAQIARARFEPLEQPEARSVNGLASGAATTVTRLDSRFAPAESAEARCVDGPASAPSRTVPALVAQLIQKLADLDAILDLDLDIDDESWAMVERHLAARKEATPEASPPCTLPGCKSCTEPATAGAKNQLTMEVFVKDPAGLRVVDATSRIDSALKTPGKTEVQYIPLGGHFALEIKATLVPAPAGVYKESEKKAAPATNP